MTAGPFPSLSLCPLRFLLDPSTDALAVAAVNATILTILVTVGSGYLLLILQNIDEIRSAAINTAENIKYLKWLPEHVAGTMTYPVNAKEREAFLDKLRELMQLKEGEDANELYERGLEALRVLTAVFKSYPFSEETRVLSNREPFAFSSFEKVEEWCLDAQMFIQAFKSRFFLHMGDVREFFEAVGERWETEKLGGPLPFTGFGGPTAKPHSDDWQAFIFSASPRYVPGRIEEFIGGLAALQEAVQAYVDRLNRYRRQLVSPRLLLPAVLVASVAFLAGVILPLFWESAPRLVTAAIPSAFYLSVLGTAIWMIVTFYRRVPT